VNRAEEAVLFFDSLLSCTFTGMQTSLEKLTRLRNLMKNSGIDVYLIPSTDPHLGEYIPEHWQIMSWLTGFTGSAGTIIVTNTFAGLWTDSRYFIQAENQLKDSGFVLMNPSLTDKSDLNGWMSGYLTPGSVIAFDGRLFSIERTKRISRSLAGKNISINSDCDLISGLWTDRPPIPVLPAFDHSVSFCGKDRAAKIAEVREQMKIMGADYHLLTSIDDIMWMLNIRGNDVKYSPLMISFAVVGEEQIFLFTEESKIPFRLASEFDRLGIVMLPYEETAGMLSTLSPEATVLLNPLTTSSTLYNSLPPEMKILEEITIPTHLKSIKNITEIENIRRVMIRDGVVLTKFFFWFENKAGSQGLTEVLLGEKISSLRSEAENYLGPSFSTIVAYNQNGALPHYSSDSRSDAVIGPDGILLIDSGGQYLDGTTDITRTIPTGNSNVQQKQDFTLVLKGMINLSQAKFPSGSKGYQLDFVARRALWEKGLNYGHGTGHGVGFCLNVHEGPQSISPGFGPDAKTVIEPGMLISAEPAIYREGEYGIRIENLILCTEDKETDFGKFLKFDTVSLCYIEKSLIEISLLDEKEIDWLNNYHTEVYNKLYPFLTSEENAWLRNKTKHL
jgi:Xaa-Pro aminopeptidase